MVNWDEVVNGIVIGVGLMLAEGLRRLMIQGRRVLEKVEKIPDIETRVEKIEQTTDEIAKVQYHHLGGNGSTTPMQSRMYAVESALGLNPGPLPEHQRPPE